MFNLLFETEVFNPYITAFHQQKRCWQVAQTAITIQERMDAEEFINKKGHTYQGMGGRVIIVPVNKMGYGYRSESWGRWVEMWMLR